MNEITQIRKLSLWIFHSINSNKSMPFYFSNPEFLENTFFTVEQIGRSGFQFHA